MKAAKLKNLISKTIINLYNLCNFTKVCYRTGSSLLGEIVSVNPKSSYFFEPLHSFKDKFSWKGQVAPKDEKFSNFVLNLSQCVPNTVNFVRMNKFTLKKSKNTECLEGADVVIKTIRLTAEHVREILKNADDKEAFKIIHLIRQESEENYFCF